MTKKQKRGISIERGTELAYRSVRYSRAFTAKVGFTEFRYTSDVRKLREIENNRNEKWNKVKI